MIVGRLTCTAGDWEVGEYPAREMNKEISHRSMRAASPGPGKRALAASSPARLKQGVGLCGLC